MYTFIPHELVGVVNYSHIIVRIQVDWDTQFKKNCVVYFENFIIANITSKIENYTFEYAYCKILVTGLLR